MKRVILSLIVGLMVLYVGNKTTEALNENDLQALAEGIKRVDPAAEITDWTMLARASADRPYSVVTADIQKKYTNYVWKKETDSNGKSLIGTYLDEKLKITTTIKIMSIDSENPVLITSIEGTEWTDEQVNFIQNWLKNGTKGIIKDKPQYFSCIKGITGAKMDKVLLKNWMSIFEAKSMESAIESNFISVTAQSNQFNNKMTNGMNLQLAFREWKENRNTGKTLFTSGTPIIAFEY
mgnify:CR=1 FL=1